MRKTTFVETLILSVFLFSLFGTFMVCPQVSAQNAVQETVPAVAAPAVAMPGDPKERMLLAARTNGLAGDDVKPWHLKATYRSLDDESKVKDEGTYEEFWVSSKKFKRTFIGTSFAQTEYGTDKGILVSGQQSPQPDFMNQLRNEFVNPIVIPEPIQRTKFELKQREVGGIKFDCLNTMTSAGIPWGTVSCLGLGKSILLINSSQGGTQAIHSRAVKFQERYIAEDLRFARESKLLMTAHLDTIELLTKIEEALFQPPPDATVKPLTVSLASGVTVGMLLKKVQPEYPRSAKPAFIQGTVVLQAKIGKDGRIVDLHVISGPSELQNAALDAVRQWVYRPYLLMGQPVDVLTTINVIFTLGDQRPGTLPRP
jgi:TonB family protein